MPVNVKDAKTISCFDSRFRRLTTNATVQSGLTNCHTYHIKHKGWVSCVIVNNSTNFTDCFIENNAIKFNFVTPCLQ